MRSLFFGLCFGLLAVGASAQVGTTVPIIQTQTFHTDAGDVKITPIYHASVLVQGGGMAIYIDPAKPGKFDGLPKADLILITHAHGDHVDQDQASIKAVNKSATQILSPAEVTKIVPTAEVIANGEKKQFGGWTVEAVPAYNLQRGPSAGKFYHPKGTGNGYVLSYGGRRFYFSGDTENIPEMRALNNIDVAFICINLPYTMTIDEAAEAVRNFHPKIVIPYHYRSTPPTDLKTFKQKLEGTGIEVRLLDWYPPS
jgi:L-ascorbate metabolism protein UlaG (beta-lactamase superfamily)